MTLRHLRIFITVYQQCSITKASELLHLAQPSVSLAILELEHYYGLKLFDRIGRRLGITENAHSFYHYASHIIALYDEMEQSVTNFDASGTLRVGASVTAGNDGFLSLIRQFQEQHPSFRVEVTINNYKQIEQAILENHIDLALIEGNSSHPQLLSTPYRDNHMVFVASPSYHAFTEHFAEKKQLSIRELESCDFILREQGSANRALFDSLMVLYDMEGKILWESISTQAIINAVKEGLGVSLLSWALVKQAVHAGELIVLPIQESMLKRSFCIIYHKNKYLTPAATDFIRICKESNP